MTSSFHSLHEFFTMRNYGLYVWSSYGIAMLIIGINIVNALRKTRLTHQKLQDEHRNASHQTTQTHSISYDES